MLLSFDILEYISQPSVLGIKKTIPIIGRNLRPKYCNYGEVETILFFESVILDMSNVEKDNTSRREERTESRSVW